ncbi:hypothetical protein [Afipia sp. GAS231]|uniref:hypothetical protein n=1 Tax=Afipia sp. GAS231 TaxID=1882747 RepID=UPI00087BC74D|nr:hypothetical protein [Afipia sp. GAS231]SDP21253.1 hypothetical protein SAMN05444050_6154 [Afipia sp. GAS231]
MEPWFIATKPFGPGNGDAWNNYVAWSGLSQLREVVSLDENLCPTVLPDIPDHYWPHIVNENYMLRYFRDIGFLLKEVNNLAARNLLCVYRDPPAHPSPAMPGFRFLGYDLVDYQGRVSALSNCGGFPTVFANSELSDQALLTSHSRAVRVQAGLREHYPDEPHADCHCWAIFRLEQP